MSSVKLKLSKRQGLPPLVPQTANTHSQDCKKMQRASIKSEAIMNLAHKCAAFVSNQN